MARASTVEAEIARRAKISVAMKQRGPKGPWKDDARTKHSASLVERWANTSEEARSAIADNVSLARMAVVLCEDPNSKKCRSCKRVVSRDNFAGDSRNRDGLQGRCRECQNAAVRISASEKPEKVLYFRRRRYGIKFEQMWDQQQGMCALCGLPMKLRGQSADSVCIDHDHACCPTVAKSCGKCVRGLIHSNCNRMLGQAKDNPELLQLGAEYLRRWEKLRD